MAALEALWSIWSDDGAESVCLVTAKASRLASFSRRVTWSVTDFSPWSHLIVSSHSDLDGTLRAVVGPPNDSATQTKYADLFSKAS